MPCCSSMGDCFMDFFNKLRAKLKIKNLCSAILFLLLAALFSWIAISNGFSSETGWRIGIRGSRSGIPIPNWLISCFLLLLGLIFVVSAFLFLVSFVKDTEYKKMLQNVYAIGDADMIGTMIAAMKKSTYTKGGDLRFNERLVFYMKGTDVAVIPSASIRDIRTEIVSRKNSEENYVCIYHENDVLKIRTSEKNVLLLLEEMKNIYHFQ